MILMLSDGISSANVEKVIAEYVPGKKKRVIVITNADYKHKKNTGGYLEDKKIFEKYGYRVFLFDLEKDLLEDLKRYDIFYFSGGNPYALNQALQNSHSISLFKELEKNHLFIGVSGGALSFQMNLNLLDTFYSFLNRRIQLKDLSGLELTSIEFLPHRSYYEKTVPDFLLKVTNYQNENRKKIYLIDDGEGVLISQNTGILIKK